jgi:hypothetical protein
MENSFGCIGPQPMPVMLYHNTCNNELRKTMMRKRRLDLRACISVVGLHLEVALTRTILGLLVNGSHCSYRHGN